MSFCSVQRVYEEDVSKDETTEEEEKTVEPEKVFICNLF